MKTRLDAQFLLVIWDFLLDLLLFCHFEQNVSDSSWDFRCPLTPLNPCCPPSPVCRRFPRPAGSVPACGRRLHREKKSTKVEATKSMEAASWKMYQSLSSKAFFRFNKNHQMWQNNNKKLRTAKLCISTYM